MIIKAHQRGKAIAHGLHMLNDENEHITVHEVSGYISDDVMNAMREEQAIARGTKCTQFLFHASFNAPEDEEVTTEAYINAIDKFQHRQGLDGQPRMIIFHEKEGRRHAHATWSRIDRERMTAKQMSHFKRKSQEVSRELFIEHGWKMPEGLSKGGRGSPLNFTLAEWQQAKRLGQHAGEIKANLQDAWAMSDSKQSFEKALKQRGFYLARGDRRGHVAVTYGGEVLSIARMIGQKTKAVTERLGDAKSLPSIDQTKEQIAKDITPVIKRHIRDHQRKAEAAFASLKQQRHRMVQDQRTARAKQKASHAERWQKEQMMRSKRFRSGFKGLWDRLNGKHTKLRKQNEKDTQHAQQRDKQELNALTANQMDQRQALQSKIKQERQNQTKQRRELYRDIERYKTFREPKGRPNQHERMEIER